MWSVKKVSTLPLKSFIGHRKSNLGDDLKRLVLSCGLTHHSQTPSAILEEPRPLMLGGYEDNKTLIALLILGLYYVISSDR